MCVCARSHRTVCVCASGCTGVCVCERVRVREQERERESASDNPPTNYSVGGANGEQSRNGNE